MRFSSQWFSAVLMTSLACHAGDVDRPQPDPESAEASITEGVMIAPPMQREHPLPAAPEVHEPDSWEHATGHWGGARSKLEDRGVAISADLTVDFSKNLVGGLDTEGSAFRHLFNFNITLDSEKLAGYKGGTFFVNFQAQHGQSGSDETGDFQGISNIDADGRAQVSEIWYQQLLLGDRLRLKAGKIDANVEFAAPEYAGDFINSSFGVSPTILGIPTYPDPSFGIVIVAQPTESVYLSAGVFDGAGQEGYTTGDDALETVFGSPSDLFLICECGLRWKCREDTLNGRLALGVWHHTGTFDEFDGDTADGATGPYLIAEQQIWKESQSLEDEQGIALSLQYGFAEASISEVEHHIGAAVTWIGAIPSRDDDASGVGLTCVCFGEDAGFSNDIELTLELFHKFQIAPFASVKPDLQYIVNPGGNLDNALAASVRLSIDF
jgi:porin